MKTALGFFIGVVVTGAIAIAAYFVHNSPDARLVPDKANQAYNSWCDGLGGHTWFDRQKRPFQCSVAPKGVK